MMKFKKRWVKKNITSKIGISLNSDDEILWNSKNYAILDETRLQRKIIQNWQLTVKNITDHTIQICKTQ